MAKVPRKHTNKVCELKDAAKYALSLKTYRLLKSLNSLGGCLPQEKSTCGSVDDALGSLRQQYRVDDLMNIRSPEYKKGKELFLASLFAYILRTYTKNEYAICVPTEDRGIDIFVREIDYQKHLIIMHPLQICEMPERHLPRGGGMPEDLARAVFDFVKEKKLGRYPASVDGLLVWIEAAGDRHLDLVKCRALFDEEPDIPFVQIVGFGRGRGDIFNVATLYSRNATAHFGVEYHYLSGTVDRVRNSAC